MYGGPHTSLPSVAHLKPGDLVYPVMVKDGTLFVIGRMRIQAILPFEHYTRQHPDVLTTTKVTRDPATGGFKPYGRHPGHRLPQGCTTHVAVG